MVQVTGLHRAVLAVVADHDQDPQVVPLRGTQGFDHRVVKERAVPEL
jgi:hypothetical protein